MPRIDLSTYLADDTLDLDGIPSTAHPEGGSYKIPSLSGADGLLLQVITDGSDDKGEKMSAEAIEAMVQFCRDDGGEPVSLQEKLFGKATLAQMVADGVTNTNLHATMTVVMTQASLGAEMAQRYVDKVAAGEAPARANRATRRAAAQKPSSSPRKAGSRSVPASGAKNTPRTPASTRGRGASSNPQSKAG